MINTSEIIKSHNFPIQKKYGQNFLTDKNILQSIVEAAQINKNDLVLEIGPGLGALTEQLCMAAGHVIAVEIDKMLIPILKENLSEHENITLVNEDILCADIDKLAEGALSGMENHRSASAGNDACAAKMLEGNPKMLEENPKILEENPKILEENPKMADGNRDCAYNIKVVANLPYYITTPIIMKLLEKQENIESITVMVQKEVAERMKEGPGSKAYGALSLAVQYYAQPKLAFIVSKNCFFPKPDVDSAVIHLNIYKPEERPVKAADTQKMFDIIHAAFNQRRKTLVNALSNAQNLDYSREQILKAVASIGKPETIRGEALTLNEFAALSDII